MESPSLGKPVAFVTPMTLLEGNRFHATNEDLRDGRIHRMRVVDCSMCSELSMRWAGCSEKRKQGGDWLATLLSPNSRGATYYPADGTEATNSSSSDSSRSGPRIAAIE